MFENINKQDNKTTTLIHKDVTYAVTHCAPNHWLFWTPGSVAGERKFAGQVLNGSIVLGDADADTFVSLARAWLSEMIQRGGAAN